MVDHFLAETVHQRLGASSWHFIFLVNHVLNVHLFLEIQNVLLFGQLLHITTLLFQHTQLLSIVHSFEKTSVQFGKGSISCQQTTFSEEFVDFEQVDRK